MKHMNRTNLIIGFVSGLLLSLGFLGPLIHFDFSQADSAQGEQLGYGLMLLSSAGALTAMFFGRRKNPEIGFTALIKQGLFTLVITVLVFYTANVLFYSVIRPDFLSQFYDAFALQKAERIPDAAKKAEYLAGMEKDRHLYTNAFLYGGIMAATVFFISLMPIAIFGYLIFRLSRRKKIQNTPN
jgi:hypothetical protein